MKKKTHPAVKFFSSRCEPISISKLDAKLKGFSSTSIRKVQRLVINVVVPKRSQMTTSCESRILNFEFKVLPTR